jgi:hypothetical protein
VSLLAIVAVVVILTRGGDGKQPAAGPASTRTAPTIPARLTPPQRIGDFVLQPNPTLDSDVLTAGFSASYKSGSPTQLLIFGAHHALAPDAFARELAAKISAQVFRPGASIVPLTSAGTLFTCITGLVASNQSVPIGACVWPTGSVVFSMVLTPASDPQVVIALASQAQAATRL